MRAFSLVELSIVLVILGLLTGGILSGQSLIRAAELRAVSTEYQTYSTAAHSFRDRYMALPGDMKNATQFWGKDNAACTSHTGTASTPGTCNGNGDGRIEVTATAANQTSEHFQYWKHLSLAGLVEGTYSGLSGSAGNQQAIIADNIPASKLSNTGWGVRWTGVVSGVGGAFIGDYANQATIGAQLATNNSAISAVLKPEEAWNIDTKIDDGRPSYGKVIGFPVTTSCVIADSGGLSATNLDASYNLTGSAIGCVLYFPRIL